MFCPSYVKGCYLKDREFYGSEAVGSGQADCKTMYKMPCGATPAPAQPGNICYGELTGLAAQEGGSVRTVWTKSNTDCQKSCTETAGCDSISFCPRYREGCYLKDREVYGSEAVGSNAV